MTSNILDFTNKLAGNSNVFKSAANSTIPMGILGQLGSIIAASNTKSGKSSNLSNQAVVSKIETQTRATKELGSSIDNLINISTNTEKHLKEIKNILKSIGGMGAAGSGDSGGGAVPSVGSRGPGGGLKKTPKSKGGILGRILGWGAVGAAGLGAAYGASKIFEQPDTNKPQEPGWVPPNTQSPPPMSGESGGARKGSSASPYYGTDAVKSSKDGKNYGTDSVNLEAGSKTFGESRSKSASSLTPDQKEKMLALTLAEVGDKSPAEQRRLMETIFNRSEAHSKDLDSIMNPRYYQPFQNGAYDKALARIRSNPELRKKLEQRFDEVVKGSNDSNFATHNSSAHVAESARKTQTITSDEGETFSRKDKPEHAQLHGEKTTQQESDWYKRKKAAYDKEIRDNPVVDISKGPIEDRSAKAGFGNTFGKFGPNGVEGLIVHHTAGRGNANGVISTFQQRRFPAQYIMERDGKIVRALPEGSRGAHMRPGQGVGKGFGNWNTEGIEVIAKNNRDWTQEQRQAMAKFTFDHAKKHGYDPKERVFGHGEVNPHKEKDEGQFFLGWFRKNYDQLKKQYDENQNKSTKSDATVVKKGKPAPASEEDLNSDPMQHADDWAETKAAVERDIKLGRRNPDGSLKFDVTPANPKAGIRGIDIAPENRDATANKGTLSPDITPKIDVTPVPPAPADPRIMSIDQNAVQEKAKPQESAPAPQSQQVPAVDPNIKKSSDSGEKNDKFFSHEKTSNDWAPNVMNYWKQGKEGINV